MSIDLGVILAGVLFIHGIAHLVGFAVPWGLIDRERVTVTGTLLDGHVRIGATAQRVVGIVWLLLAIAFMVAGTGIARGEPRWVSFAQIVTIASAAMCVVGWPAARIGFAVDVVLLVTLTSGTHFGWI